MTSSPERAFATRTVHHPTIVPTLASVVTPIYQTSTYRAEKTATLAEFASDSQPTSFFSRNGNPTVEVWERVIADLEEGERGLAFASGIAAISCVLTGLLQPGDHVVAGNLLYTATLLLMTEELPRMGVAADFVEATRAESLAQAAHPKTRMFYIETPSNPTMLLTDLATVCRSAREREICTVADNTFATPYNQRPLALGAMW